MYLTTKDVTLLHRAFRRLDQCHRGFLTAHDVTEALHDLGASMERFTKEEVQMMIWEVDTVGDGHLRESDLVDMLVRVRNDNSGYEPQSLANLIEFLMYDRRGKGKITVEECMGILTRRFPATVKVSRPAIRNFCVEHASVLNQEITFSEYLRQLEYRRMLISTQ